MMEEYFPRSQDHPLCGLSDALIGGSMNDAKGLEVDPHGVSGIRQPPVCVGVCRQQVREFIVDDRFWNWQKRQQSGS